MKTLILMRHGETLSNIAQIYQGQGDGILSPKGKQQARAAAKYFSDVKIDAIYCSDLCRSFETASIIGKYHKTKIIKIKNLRERFYGEWEGLGLDTIKKKYGKLYDKWIKDPGKAKIPYAETLEDIQKRGVKAIKKIIDPSKDGVILIVGHGGLNRAILFHYLGMDVNNFWKVRQDNCCFNVIEFVDPHPKVVLFNSTCHLGEKSLSKKNALA